MLHVKMSNGYKREYKTRLIESSASSTPLPKLNFNSKAVLTAMAFDKVLSDVQVVSEYISIEASRARSIFPVGATLARPKLRLRQATKGWKILQSRRKARPH